MTHAPLPPNSSPAGIDGPAAAQSDLFAGLEQQLGRLRDVQREHAEQAKILSEREAGLDEREVVLAELEAELADRTRALESAKSELGDRTSQVERSMAVLDERATELKEAEARAEQERAQLLSDAQESRAQLDEERLMLSQLQRTLEVEREALDAELREAAAAQVDLLERIRAIDARQEAIELERMELDEQQAAVQIERSEMEERSVTIAERERALLEERAALDEGIHEAVIASAEALAERDEALERAEAAATSARERTAALMEELVALRTQLAESETTGAEAQELADQVASLTEERSALLRRVVVLETSLTELTSGDLATSLQAELGVLREERTALLERLAALELSLEEATQRAELLSTASELNEPNEEIAQRLNELEAEMSRQKDLADLAGHCRDEAEREAQELRERVEELVKQAAAQTAAAQQAAQVAPVAPSSAPDAAMRDKAHRLADIARHLKLRQLRLERYRAVVQMRRGQEAPEREDASEFSISQAVQLQPVAAANMPTDAAARAQRREADLEQHAAQVRHLEQQKHEIAEARRALTIKERRMIRRWAQPRAIAVTAWLGLLLCLSAGVSWLLVTHFYPPTISARVDIEPRSNRIGTLPDDLLHTWQRAHLDIVSSSAFHTQVARRMKELKFPAWESEAAVARTITQDLTSDLLNPGRITLVLAGKSKHEVTLFLDVLATTLAAESARQYRRLGDGVWGVAMGERRESDQLRYSTVNPVPMRDDRMRMFAPVMGAVFGIALIVIVAVYMQLSRVKREFDSDGALFDDEPIAASV